MKGSLVVPFMAGILLGAALLAVDWFVAGGSMCTCTIVIFLIFGLVLSIISPLTSGPAFGGWIKASSTGISGMRSDIGSRSGLGLEDRLGAVVFMTAALAVYFIGSFLI